MKNIIITGGSGLIGRGLSSYLEKEGNQVGWLSRGKFVDKQQAYLWNPDKTELDMAALTDKDVLIQLAGSNIADGRWTTKRKRDIIESRVKAIQNLYKHLKKNQLRIPHIIQASAIGIYGDRGSEFLNEYSHPGNEGFLTEVCKIWETEATSLKEFTDCFTIIRTGLYMSPKGGIWPKMIQTKRFGFLVSFGDGSQFYSWIHHLDYNRAISQILKQQLSGVINLTAPNPISNKDLIFEINQQLKRKVFQFAVPEFLLKLILGELSQSVLSSAFVLPQVLIKSGFEFQFEKLDKAIIDLLNLKPTDSRVKN